MIEIEGPDGVIYEFPEGTSEDVMRQALSQVYGAPAQSPEMTAGLSELSALSQPVPDEPSMFNDIGGAALAGLSRGVTGIADIVPTPNNMARNIISGAGDIAGLFGADSEAISGYANQLFPTTGSLMSDLTGGATEYRGESVPAQYAGTVAEFIPGAVAGALTGGGATLPSVAKEVIRYGVIPGLTSEAAGQMTDGSALEPYARVAGALAGSIAPAAIEKGIRKIISPYGGADPNRIAMADALVAEGVPVTAGQRVGNEALRRKEGLTLRGQDIVASQGDEFTAAALKSIGVDAKRATPEVLAKAADDIGQVFDDVTRGVDVIPDITQAQRAVDASKMAMELSPGSLPPYLKRVETEILDAATGGKPIPASTLKVWRSNLSKLTKSADAATREGAIEMLGVIDDTMAATLTSLGRTEDVARLAIARAQWRDLLAIEKAAGMAGENAAAGVISPSGLRGAVKTQGNSAYVRGQRGDLADLARAGEGVLKPLPNSGTPGGMAALGITPQNMMAALGGGAGYGSMGPYGAIVGALAGSAVPALAGAARMSRPVQAYLGNQLVGRGPDIFTRGVISPVVAALLGYEQEETR